MIFRHTARRRTSFLEILKKIFLSQISSFKIRFKNDSNINISFQTCFVMGLTYFEAKVRLKEIWLKIYKKCFVHAK